MSPRAPAAGKILEGEPTSGSCLRFTLRGLGFRVRDLGSGFGVQTLDPDILAIEYEIQWTHGYSM